MTLLIAGLAIFFLIHIVSSTPLKAAIVNATSENAYKGAFSLIALVGLVLAICGKAVAPFEPVWNALPQLRGLTMPLMWVSFILLPAANMKGNIKRFTRHPMMWGILIWASAHLLVNGDLASMLLFGSFAVYSVYAMITQTMRGAQKQTTPRPFKYDLIVFAAGTTTFLVVLFLHGVLFGVPLR